MSKTMMTLNIGLATSEKYNHESPNWEEVTKVLDGLFVKYKMRLVMSDTEPTLVVHGEYDPMWPACTYNLAVAAQQEAVAVLCEHEGGVFKTTSYLSGEYRRLWGEFDPSKFITWEQTKRG